MTLVLPEAAKPTTKALLVPALLAVSASFTGTSQATETDAECAKAQNRVVDYNGSKPCDIWDDLKGCSKADCPEDIRKFCEDKLRVIATVVFRFRDSRDLEVKHVNIRVDGEALVQKLDRPQVCVTPGGRTFEFEAPGMQKKEIVVDVAPGKQDKPVTVVLEPLPTPPQPPPPQPSRRRMLPVTAGSFKMGLSSGKPTRVDGFQMDEKEVTANQYQSCVEAGKCTPAGEGSLCNANQPSRQNHPINCVTHQQAEAYCAWEGKELPTEERWEYAARGMEGFEYPWGNQPPTAGNLCWSRRRQWGTCGVGSHKAGASPFELLDMAGNVWEWTSTRYCSDSDSACTNERFIIKGGDWFRDDPALVRAATRDWKQPSHSSPFLGVRCASR